MVIINREAGKKGYFKVTVKAEDPQEARQLQEAFGGDEVFDFEVSLEVLLRRGLNKGACIALVELKDLMAEDDLVKARETALKLLDYRMRTVKEVEDKLREKGFGQNTIEHTVASLSEYGLLDDRDYAAAYLKGRIAQRGSRVLEQELAQKGVDRELARELMANLETAEDEAALEACRKKYRSLKNRGLEKNILQEKVYRFMISRGYPYDLTKRVYNTVLEQAEEEGNEA